MAEWRAALPRDACNPAVRPSTREGEQVVSRDRIALAWEHLPESSFPSGGQSPQPPRTPVFNGSMNTWQAWGLESLRETSAMRRRGQRPCCGVYSTPRFLARGREGERGREVWGGGMWCRGFSPYEGCLPVMNSQGMFYFH